MKWFLLRLIATRPDFAFTMTDAERATMARHSGYWRGHLEQGTALVFSPVADPAGPWGLCIARATDAEGARALTEHDPAVTDGVGQYEILELFSPVLSPNAEASSAPGG